MKFTLLAKSGIQPDISFFGGQWIVAWQSGQKLLVRGIIEKEFDLDEGAMAFARLDGSTSNSITYSTINTRIGVYNATTISR